MEDILKKVPLIVLTALAILLTACVPTTIEGPDTDLYESSNFPTIEDEENTSSDEISEASDVEPDVGYEWIVEPEFLYDDIICIDGEGVIARGNGIYIDQKTGKEIGPVFGHGVDAICLYYDENEGLYGIFFHGDGEPEINYLKTMGTVLFVLI